MSHSLKAATTNPAAMLALPEVIHSASLLKDAGKIADACTLYAAWIEANPAHPLLHAALFNLSTLYSATGEHLLCMQALERAIAYNGEFLPAYINLGRMFEDIKEPDRALALWYSGVNRPMQVTSLAVQHMVTLLKQIARVQMDREQPLLAEHALARAIGIDPSQDEVLEQYLALRMRELRWPVLAPVDPMSAKDMLARFHPLSVAAFTDDPLMQLAAGHNYARRLIAGDLPETFDRRNAPIDLTGRRIRVGYLSSDLRDHAIGYLLTEFFELQDKTEIEAFAYFIGQAPPSAISTRIEAAVEHWHDLRGWSDDAIADLITKHEIDILVDVNGHTRDARLGVLARRPAPIQVNWLGFPGSMGTPYHHYIIADPFIIPPEAEKYYSEKVARLPCYQANDRKRAVAERPTRASVGLPEDTFVFCSFNAMHKLTHFTIDRWITILKNTPNSVLWLLDCSAQAKQALALRFEKGGVAASRLVFAEKIQNAYHLARYPLADLFLDALPYGAHTTASDALWMGVPMLTLAGRCFAARVCGSLVSAAGLEDMVVADADAYVARAIALARNPDEIAALKARVIANRDTSVLFDQPGLARAMADLFKGMVADYQAGALPEPDLANLDRYHDAALSFDHEAVEMAGAADYDGLYRAYLERAHRRTPLAPDTRLSPAGAPGSKI